MAAAVKKLPAVFFSLFQNDAVDELLNCLSELILPSYIFLGADTKIAIANAKASNELTPTLDKAIKQKVNIARIGRQSDVRT